MDQKVNPSPGVPWEEWIQTSSGRRRVSTWSWQPSLEKRVGEDILLGPSGCRVWLALTQLVDEAEQGSFSAIDTDRRLTVQLVLKYYFP